MRRFLFLLLILGIVLVVFVFAIPVAAERLDRPNQGGRSLSATLTGAAEVPGPGDPDGSGTARLILNRGQGEICFKITVANITLPASAAHIHVGPAGVAGGIVVTLTAPNASGSSSGCVSVDSDLVTAIGNDPSAYYVNVHTSDFPGGAVRGQLSK